MTNMKNTTDRSQEDFIAALMEREGIQMETRTLGVTPDFIWYESEILIRKADEIRSRFKHLISVMEQRHKDQNKVISELLDNIKDLKSQLKEKQNERT